MVRSSSQWTKLWVQIRPKANTTRPISSQISQRRDEGWIIGLALSVTGALTGELDWIAMAGQCSFSCKFFR